MDGPQFFILLLSLSNWLDGNHVVSGKAMEGVSIMEAMEQFGPRNDRANKIGTNAGCEQL